MSHRNALTLFTAKPNGALGSNSEVVYNMVHAGFDFPSPIPGDICGCSLNPIGTTNLTPT